MDYRLERASGAFQRVIPLPAEVEGDKAKAVFQKGLLTIALPKAVHQKAAGRRIEIKAAA